MDENNQDKDIGQQSLFFKNLFALQNYYKFYEFRNPLICFTASFRNKKMQHAENQHVARFVSSFVTFRTLFHFYTEDVVFHTVFDDD